MAENGLEIGALPAVSSTNEAATNDEGSPLDEPNIEPPLSPLVGGTEEDTSFQRQIEASDEKITLLSALNYTPGESVHVYLPGLPIVATVTASTNRLRTPVFKIALEHGPFEWEVSKSYLEFFTLRRVLYPYRMRVRTGRRGRQHVYLPHLFSVGDIDPRGGMRAKYQVTKVQRFINAVLSDRQLRTHRSTLKFLEISRLSFLEDLGLKRKEGILVKRSGGHRRVTNCLGCHACCVCRCSVWRQRWIVLKDSYLAYVRSDRHSVAGVVLFDHPMTVEVGISRTGVRFGLKITTQTRELLLKCGSHKSSKRWKDAIEKAMSTTGKEWVEKKPLDSFAPVRTNSTVKWFVDGEGYMKTVAMALLAAKEEIYITDWMLNPHIYLKRDECETTMLQWRLDKILLRKANEGVRVFIQLYKEVELAIGLGSEYCQSILRHKNIVVYRHPEHIQTGIYLWAHHEKIVVIDQTLAFVGGIDLAFGRWDTHCHYLGDHGRAPPQNLSELARGTVTEIEPCHHDGEEEEREGVDASAPPLQKWIGKDYYNTFVKDFIDLDTPLDDLMDRDVHPRMPWHDIASCVYGPAARDVARHFIQRHNFTRHEQAQKDDPALLPRKAFTKDELETTKYLRDIIVDPPTTNATVQVLRSSGGWTVGIDTEHSIYNAYLDAIENAEHFIYIEQQFFISSLPSDDVLNGIAEALRLRISRAHKENQQFRVVIVMPLLPGLAGEIGKASGTVLEAVMHWTYTSISRGKESLISRLINIDGIPSNEVCKYFSVYGLRATGTHAGVPATEILYVHSKCMIVDDKVTIIGSANINDRSQLGDRDSEVAVLVRDEEMIDGIMNGQPYKVGKFSHSLRCHLFKEHLGLLEEQTLPVARKDIDVTDPACDAFYLGVWLDSAERNQEILDEVFGGRSVPSDKAMTYEQLRIYKENPGVVGRDVERAKVLLTKMQGSIVPLALRFMEDEDLLPDLTDKEAYTPEKLLQ